MCVEGRLKQEKIQGCWFVDGEVPSIRMQVKWETFFLISLLNNMIECLFGNWLDLSDLSTDREPKARNSNIASFWVSVLTSFVFHSPFTSTI